VLTHVLDKFRQTVFTQGTPGNLADFREKEIEARDCLTGCIGIFDSLGRCHVERFNGFRVVRDEDWTALVEFLDDVLFVLELKASIPRWGMFE
jgi:hypothetical protein